MMGRKAVVFSKELSKFHLLQASDFYGDIISENIRFILSRYGMCKDWPWIDTKYNLIMRCNFSDDDVIKGKSTIYSWIQGRGLEAISEILRKSGQLRLSLSREEILQAHELLRALFERMYRVWKQNNRHFSFMMSPDGYPIKLSGVAANGNVSVEKLAIEEKAKYTISDIFCAKGLLSTALYLNENGIADEITEYCKQIYQSAFDSEIENDQYFFDSANPAIPRAGKISHAPFMLLIGMMCLLAEYTDMPDVEEMGLKLVNHVIEHHVNINGKWEYLRDYDFVEAIDANGQPYTQDGQILSDSGHALEFVGLSMKLFNILKKRYSFSGIDVSPFQKIEEVLANVFFNSFRNGFVEKFGGICKSFDLVAREIVNSEMPWWALPETMRAAVFLWEANPKLDSKCVIADNENDAEIVGCEALSSSKYIEIFSACHNAFVENYIVEDFYLLAIQSRNGEGNISDKIPAIPDIDPCYHTCLSLLDCMCVIRAKLA